MRASRRMIGFGGLLLVFGLAGPSIAQEPVAGGEIGGVEGGLLGALDDFSDDELREVTGGLLDDDPIDKITAAIEDWRYSDGLAMSRKAIAADPDNAGLHHYYGILLRDVEDFKRAIHEIERASALAPDDANITADLAWAYLGDNDLAKATVLIEQAKKLGADTASVAELERVLSTVNGNLNGDVQTVEPGSSREFVYRLAKQLQDGDLSSLLDDYLSPLLLARLSASVDMPEALGEQVAEGMLEGFVDEFKESFEKDGGVFKGWTIDDETTPGPLGGEIVTVQLLTYTRQDPTHIAALRRAVRDEEFAGGIDAEDLKLLRGLTESDREALFERRLEHDTLLLMPMEINVSRSGAGWQIDGLDVNGVAIEDLVRASKEMLDSGFLTAEDIDGKSALYRTGEVVGKLFGLFALVWLFLSFFRKREQAKQPIHRDFRRDHHDGL